MSFASRLEPARSAVIRPETNRTHPRNPADFLRCPLVIDYTYSGGAEAPPPSIDLGKSNQAGMTSTIS